MQLARGHNGSVVLRGRHERVERPRSRSRENTEIELDTWKVFSSQDLLDSLVVDAGSSA
jgi:hypothetical protein